VSKIVGVDYGKARVGLAASDERHRIAFPLTCLKAHRDLSKTVQAVALFLTSIACLRIVIGLPLLMNGKDSDLTKEVRQFATLLEEVSSQPIILWDERLTSKQAEKLLIEGGVKRKQRTSSLDTMAATLILQSYLDAQQPSP
jgi:putative holliday junction resolvase